MNFFRRILNTGKTAAQKAKLFLKSVQVILYQIKVYLLIALAGVIGFIYLALLVYVILYNHNDMMTDMVRSVAYKTKIDTSAYADSTSDNPLYKQSDAKWKDEEIADGITIGEAGSGICAIAGAISKALDKQISPLDVKKALGDLTLYDETNGEHVAEMAQALADRMSVDFVANTGNFGTVSGLLSQLEEDDSIICLARKDGQTFYMVKDTTKADTIKIVNSRTESGAKPGDKFYAGQATKEEIINGQFEYIGFFYKAEEE